MTISRRETLGLMATAGVAAALPKRAEAAAPHPLTLWYEQPAAEWTQALPVGNGRLGAMVFGGVARERLQLNEGTLWGGGPHDPVNPGARAALPKLREMIFAGRFAEAEAFANANVMAKPLRQMPYQGLGDLFLDFPGLGEPADYRRALDLDAAVATTRFTANGVLHERKVLASVPDRLIAVRLKAGRSGAIDVDLSFTSPHKSASARADGHELVLTGTNTAAQGIPPALRFTARARVQAKGGTVTATGDRLTVRGARELVILLAMATSFRRFDDVSGDPDALTTATLDAADKRPFARIAADATAEHRRLFRRVTLDLGTSPAAALSTDQRVRADNLAADPSLATLYFQYGRYLLISCSRPGGQAATLQGLWNDSLNPPWGSKYTVNINTEMNYWPAEAANLPECVEPLVDLIRGIAERGAHTAQAMYGARGWVCHHNTDLWRGTAPIDGAKYGLWPTGGAWLCTHLWIRWEYGCDRDFLAAAYPLMAGAARFFLDTLQRDPETGYLVTNPSLSPENGHGHGSSLCAGPTMDMAILRDLFDQTSEAAAILGRDAEFVAEMRAARARLAPFKIGAEGQLQEWQQDWDAGADDIHHRHVSHLYALYPSHQIAPDTTPDLAAAARRSLEIRGDRATGWATAWRANLWARLRDGDHAHSILAFLLGPERTYPNLFDAHPPFQIDGNFGGAAAVIEMLLQSRGDTIDLFPALPRAWSDGSITGLRARGGWQVDLAWRAGRLTQATFRADLPGTRTVLAHGRLTEITLAKGQRRTLTASSFEKGQA
ncbi:glycoside hydrolase family 95 protein [Sphingomonas cannabina]|uniref:glycoside hydrolase family 95 protein n=1 Tax=Sphingomonas cannabina TaxID=2899123 RepID=UPI001F3BB6C4|nr:glycoside hydrolase family 95 protein [Sphingomonas cannabina]UIJ46386.1 glycoside hydrolase family 95 protein [Sphingomonas cannabina]